MLSDKSTKQVLKIIMNSYIIKMFCDLNFPLRSYYFDYKGKMHIVIDIQENKISYSIPAKNMNEYIFLPYD